MSDLSGGVWRTINGARVYIKGGQVVAGPPALVGANVGSVRTDAVMLNRIKSGAASQEEIQVLIDAIPPAEEVRPYRDKAVSWHRRNPDPDLPEAQRYRDLREESRRALSDLDRRLSVGEISEDEHDAAYERKVAPLEAKAEAIRDEQKARWLQEGVDAEGRNTAREYERKALTEVMRRGYADRTMKGGHWGSARSDNPMAQAVAYAGDAVFRPLDKDMRNTRVEVGVGVALLGEQLRRYAQREAPKYRESHPTLYRGMSLPEEAVNRIVAGETKSVPLTGVTAFGFEASIGRQYADSDWTRQMGGPGRKGVVFSVKRTDAVDARMGMLHLDRGNQDRPYDLPFETLLTASRLKILSAETKPDGITYVEATIP